MKKYSLALLAMATAFALSSSAFATPITGNLTINEAGVGSDTYTATGIQFYSSYLTYTGEVGAPTNGSFASLYTPPFSAFATVDSFDFSATSGTLLTVDGLTFAISSVNVVTDSATFLNVWGLGEYTGSIGSTSYDPTDYYFSLTSTRSGNGAVGSYTLQTDPLSEPPFIVTPEPSGLLLLGTGLFGLAFFAFRKAKPAGFVANM